MNQSELRKDMERIFKSGGLVNPGPGDVHVNRPLTNISLAYMQDAAAFVADSIFPAIPVMKQSDLYWEYDRDDWNRDEAEEMRPGDIGGESDYTIASNMFHCRVYGHNKPVHDQARSNMDMPINLDMEATQFATRKLLIQRERQFISTAFASANWTFSADGSAARSASIDFSANANNNLLYWSDEDATPIEDVELMKDTVHQRTGFRPNVLALSRPVFSALKNQADIVDRMNRGQTTGPAEANRDDLMRLFEVDDLVIMDSVYNSAIKGATLNQSFIAGKNGILLYRPPNPGILIPSAGYMFSWRGFVGAEDGIRIKRIRDEKRELDLIRAQSAYDFKITGSDLAIYLNGIVA